MDRERLRQELARLLERSVGELTDQVLHATASEVVVVAEEWCAGEWHGRAALRRFLFHAFTQHDQSGRGAALAVLWGVDEQGPDCGYGKRLSHRRDFAAPHLDRTANTIRQRSWRSRLTDDAIDAVEAAMKAVRVGSTGAEPPGMSQEATTTSVVAGVSEAQLDRLVTSPAVERTMRRLIARLDNLEQHIVMAEVLAHIGLLYPAAAYGEADESSDRFAASLLRDWIRLSRDLLSFREDCLYGTTSLNAFDELIGLLHGSFPPIDRQLMHNLREWARDFPAYEDEAMLRGLVDDHPSTLDTFRRSVFQSPCGGAPLELKRKREGSEGLLDLTNWDGYPELSAEELLSVSRHYYHVWLPRQKVRLRISDGRRFLCRQLGGVPAQQRLSVPSVRQLLMLRVDIFQQLELEQIDKARKETVADGYIQVLHVAPHPAAAQLADHILRLASRQYREGELSEHSFDSRGLCDHVVIRAPIAGS